MGKVISAAEARAIGKKEIEDSIEEQFLCLMRTIASYARHNNSFELADRVGSSGSSVYEDAKVSFLQANPSQVDRLINMGYQVEQEIDDAVETSWTENEEYTVPYLYFWTQTKSRSVTKHGTVTVRKFIISWECEDCDGRDEETV